MSTPVLYIAGAGRSGSTLLEMILGNLPGFFSIGEARFFWEYVSREGESVRCGCGEPLVSCPFWSRVHEDLTAELGVGSWPRAARLARRLDRSRNLPWLLTPWAGRSRGSKELVELTGRLYGAIVRRSGARVLVDSSKVPSHLELLRQSSMADLRVLHLVRDGRAVAHAWSRRQKREPARVGPGASMPRRHAVIAALVWALENRFAERLGERTGRHVRLRYEDFVREPVTRLTAVLAHLGVEADLGGIDPDGLALAPTHSVGGNPIRFNSREPVAVRPTVDWRDGLPVGSRRLIEILVGPVLRRYGYRD